MTENATPLSPETVAALRADTPGVESVVHLNHAGSSLPPDRVLDVHIGHLRAEAALGGYEAADAADAAEAAVYDALATLVNGRPHEIARFEHATAAWNAVFWSIPMAPGQTIVTNTTVYGSDLVGMLLAAERRGVEVRVVETTPDGAMDLEDLDRALEGDVALVAATHVPTNGGHVNAVAEIGVRTRAAGVPYLLDACQSAGQLHLDVDEIGCDALSTTGRKYLRGPRGTGFAWISEALLDGLVPSQPDFFGIQLTGPASWETRPDARRFEFWEYAHAAWLGLGEAARLANELGTSAIEASVLERGAALRARLHALGATVHDMGAGAGGIVTATFDGVDSEDVKSALAAQAINVTTTGRDGAILDFERRDLRPMVRLSVHYLTTDAELDAAVEVLRTL